MPFAHESDRNLLFGILAVQLKFISREDLVAGMSSWVSQKDQPLAAILMAQGRLSAQQAQELEARVAAYLREHGDDEAEGLRAIAAGTTIASVLTPIDDDDVRASLSKIQHEQQTQSFQAPPPPDGMRYRKLNSEPFAEGGQGAVYLAEDLELFRHVALKEMKQEFADTPEFRLHFILEAEVTAGLDHPGVVPVHGLGTYADGRPYYAMRFLPGDNLDDAIKRFHAADTPTRDPGERNLAFRQLLRHFINVCNTIAYAHSRGVLHRDIKPKNIMLGKFGETLVVDWGLAKTGVGEKSSASLVADVPLNPRSQAEFDATMQGTFKGTHGYASPEQEQGRIDLLGPRSDVFSLGSTLCVLLTGEVPFHSGDRAEKLKKYKRGEFTPPLETKPTTPRPLDAICRKAMAYEPKDRYQSALDVAAEVEHWLADERVSAYPDPWTARAGRWARRHRTAVVATAVCLVTAVLGLSVSTGLIWAEQQRVAEQKQLAEENYQAAREQIFKTIDLMESSEAEFTANPKLHATRKEILVAAAHASRQFLARSSDDPELTQRAAQIYRYNANIHRFSYEVDEAEPLYRDAIGLLGLLVEKQPRTLVYQLRLSETLRDYAKLQAIAGPLGESAKTLERSLAVARPLLPEHPRSVAAALLNLSVVEDLRGQFDKSNQCAEEAAKLFREMLGGPESSKHPYDALLLASALNVQARAERERGRPEQATKFHTAAIGQMQGIVKKRPAGVNNADVLHFLALLRLEQCRTYFETPQKLATAEKNLALMILEWEKLAKAFPRVSMYREALAEAHQLLGRLQGVDVKRQTDARINLAKSRDLLLDVVKEAPKLPAARGELGRAYLELARLTERQKVEGAEADFKRAARELAVSLEQSPENYFNQRSYRSIPKKYVDEQKK